MRLPGRSMRRVAVFRRFAAVMVFVVLASLGAAIALTTLDAPDWAYYTIGLVITSAAVFRTLDAAAPRSRR